MWQPFVLNVAYVHMRANHACNVNRINLDYYCQNWAMEKLYRFRIMGLIWKKPHKIVGFFALEFSHLCHTFDFATKRHEKMVDKIVVAWKDLGHSGVCILSIRCFTFKKKRSENIPLLLPKQTDLDHIAKISWFYRFILQWTAQPNSADYGCISIGHSFCLVRARERTHIDEVTLQFQSSIYLTIKRCAMPSMVD